MSFGGTIWYVSRTSKNYTHVDCPIPNVVCTSIIRLFWTCLLKVPFGTSVERLKIHVCRMFDKIRHLDVDHASFNGVFSTDVERLIKYVVWTSFIRLFIRVF